jgi:hypothetical protein
LLSIYTLKDQNTNYFHRVANGRRRKNTMFSLKYNEIIIKGPNDLIAHATSYYKSPFGPTTGNLLVFDENMWKPHEKLTLEDNLNLTRPSTREEVKNALFSMALTKHLVMLTFLLNSINTAGILLSGTL